MKTEEIKKIKRLGTPQLLKKYEKETNKNVKAMMEEILINRKALPEKKKVYNTKKASLNDALEDAKTCRDNVGEQCTFIPFRKKAKVAGTIKQVIIDRRVNKVYYRIISEAGKLYHININNPNLKV